MNAKQRAFLDWMDYMEDAQIKDLRTEVKHGLECPICGGARMIDDGHAPTPEDGTTTARACPLCGPIYATKAREAAPEPPPF